MNCLAGLRYQGFHQADGQPDTDRSVEFNANLFRGTTSELTVQVYSVDQEELDCERIPMLGAVLPQVD